jgi:hypothetical protein
MYRDERLVICGLMATDWTAVDKAPKAKVTRSNRVGCARKGRAERAGTVAGRSIGSEGLLAHSENRKKPLYELLRTVLETSRGKGQQPSALRRCSWLETAAT